MGTLSPGKMARQLKSAFYLCTLVVWVCSCVDPSAHDVASLHSDEQQRAVHELETLLHDHHADHSNSISFTYNHAKQEGNLGEAHRKRPQEQKAGPADGLIQMGQLLDQLEAKHAHTTAGPAVRSLTSALQAKELMDTLQPNNAGSFVQHKESRSLGENSDKDHPTFHQLMHAKKKNMAAITQYLMLRKSEGRPLSADEDQQLQKFYYNRASTILKKIVLLKQGQAAPHFDDPEHDDTADKDPKESTSQVDPVTDQSNEAKSADESDKLKYDAAVANANTAYNKKKANKLVRQEEEAQAERQAEDREEMDELAFDQKVAQANEHYNEKLLRQVQKEAHNAAHVSKVAQQAAEALQAGLHKKSHMSKVEKQLEKQKKQAEHAVLRFTSEQKDAEKKVEEAEKAKADADAEAAKASEMLKQAESAAAQKTSDATKQQEAAGTKPSHLRKLPVNERLANMVQYLRTALSHHNSISQSDLKIMQNFFLQHGGQLLSKLAQIEPDATWNDHGVVSTEQWAMDHGRPDQLSKEWGGKKVKQDTLVRDTVKHELANKESHHILKRPADQQVEGLFGLASKLPLKFAPDYSKKIDKEPSLGEGLDEDHDLMHPYKKAEQAMMGIQ